MKYIFILLISVLYFGCITPRGYKLSRFSYNSKPHNSYIVGRIPDYGDGRADGCLIMNEMHLYLNRIDKAIVKGSIKNVATNEVISNAVVTVQYNGISAPISMISDSSGSFIISFTSSINKISITSIGYRSFDVIFSGRSILQKP